MSDATASMNGLHPRNDDNGADDPGSSSAVARAILKFNIGTLIPSAQVKFQGLPICASELDCALLSSYAVVIVLSYASLAASSDRRFVELYPDWASTLGCISLLLGGLATALLLMIVAPPLGWLAFLGWLFAFAFVVRRFGAQFYRLVHDAIAGPVSPLVDGFIHWFGVALGHLGLAHLSPQWLQDGSSQV